ncbi:MAG: hypothetical protein WKG06_11285 [Segetibacter sp.]
MKGLLISICTIIINASFAQTVIDTLKPKELQEVKIKSWMRRDINRLPDEENGFLNDGKKNEVISINSTNANIAIKTGRQLFAKVLASLFTIWMAAAIN